MRPMMTILLALILASSAAALEKGAAAPQIMGEQLNGQYFRLTDLPAKPKVINLFWVDCAPCRQELPLLAAKEKRYPNVEFVAVHAELNPEDETNYSIGDVAAFVNSLPAYPKNTILGSFVVKQAYGVEAFPTTVLLNADNSVALVLEGYNDKTIKQLTAWLDKQ